MTATLALHSFPGIPFPLVLCWKVQELGEFHILPLYCTRVSDASVWPLVNKGTRTAPVWAEGPRTARQTSFEHIFDGFEQAQVFASTQAQDALTSAQSRAEAAALELARVSALSVPDALPEPLATARCRGF